MTDFHVIIPARYASQRLPGKMLLDIAGKPMIQRVYECALSSEALSVTVATDDKRIADAVSSFGGSYCMTSEQHASGTDRIAEAVDNLSLGNDEMVVNLQGDEPQMPGKLIKQVAQGLAQHPDTSIATACEMIDTQDEFTDRSVVKVVRDKNDYALYFSRAPIPTRREQGGNSQLDAYRHIGLYAYRAGYVKEFTELEPVPLELIERLEQLRALWHGHKIHVSEAVQSAGIGIDTQEGLEKIRLQYK